MEGTLPTGCSRRSETRHTMCTLFRKFGEPRVVIRDHRRFVLAAVGYEQGMTNTPMHRLFDALQGRQAGFVIGRVAIVVLILAIVIVAALVALIVPKLALAPRLQGRADERDDLLLPAAERGTALVGSHHGVEDARLGE